VSAKIMGKAWDLALPHNQLLVLLAMADHADHEGNNVYPSLGLVAWKTGYSEQQVRRVIRSLVSTGILSVVEKIPGRTIKYRIDTSKGKQKEEYTPTKMIPLTKSNPLHLERTEIDSTPDMLSAKNDVEPSVLEPSVLVAEQPALVTPVETPKPKTTRKADPEYDLIAKIWNISAGGWVSNIQGMIFGSKKVKGEWAKCEFEPHATLIELEGFEAYLRKRMADKNIKDVPTAAVTIQRWFYDYRTEQNKKIIYDNEGYIPVTERKSALDGVQII